MRPSFEQPAHIIRQEAMADGLPDRDRYPEAFTRQMAEELATEIRGRFMEAFREALVGAPNFSDGMKHYLLKQDLDVPSIEIISNPQAWMDRLDDAGYEDMADVMGRDEVLFIIHLPNIMRSPVYTKIFHSDPDEPLPNNLVNGIDTLYHSVVGPIWEAADAFAEEHEIHIERINPVGIHDNRKPGEGYYYMWRIAPWLRS